MSALLTGPVPQRTGAASRRPMLVLHPDAVARNVRTVLRIARTPVLAVVKADGFGCGAEAVARAALSAGATWLGTATLDEAVALRRAGLAGPVLAWMHPVDADWETAVRLRIDVAVASVDHLLAVAAAAAGRAVARGSTCMPTPACSGTAPRRRRCRSSRWRPRPPATRSRSSA